MKWKCSKCEETNDEVSGICTRCLCIRTAEAVPLSDEEAAPACIVKKGAGFWIRALAVIIDTVVGFVVGFGAGIVAAIVLTILANQGRVDPDWIQTVRRFTMLSFLLGLIGPLFYRAIAESLTTVTIGKLICGLRVVDFDGRPIGAAQAFKRSLAYFWDGMFFGAVAHSSMSQNALKQRYGDVWAKTLVVKRSDLGETAGVDPYKIALGLLTAVAVLGLFELLGVCSKVL